MALVQPAADMAVKASEILARFRPIAPKPPSAMPTPSPPPLSHLQARPCRARKRGRPSVAPPPPPPPHAAARRKRTAVAPPLIGCAAATDAVVSTATRAGMLAGSSACLSLAPAGASAGNLTRISTEEDDDRDVPVERDLLRKLLEPKVISPRAVRPVSSTIRVLEPVSVHGAGTDDNARAASSKTAEEVEAALEADGAPPAFVSDSSNRVRLVNDAYKEMVGAPECAWLGAVAAASSRRISGEVALVVPAAALPEPPNGGFSCAARIEWERGGGERASVDAACDVTRLHCESRDYLFAWWLRTADASASRHRADK